MPVTAQDLIMGRQKPIVISPEKPAQHALELMIESNFTQLPVIDLNNRPLGMITSDSILRGVANLRIPLNQLKVAHVIEKVDQLYPAAYPIFDLLKGLNTYPAVLIIDSEGVLIGIVTSWDTADYFKKRASDMMMLEDIEDLLKAHIRAAFNKQHSINATNMLERAINEITNTDEQRSKDIRSALNKYLNLTGISHSPQENIIEDAFSKVIARSNQAKKLEDLTLYEFTRLILHNSIWPSYSSYLDIPKENLSTLLDEVRESRNALAHFKREISEWERQRIRYCIRLLEEIYPPLEIEAQIAGLSDEEVDESIPIDEDVVAKDSMYAPLALYLQNQLRDVDRLTLTFDEVEKIIGMSLPDSAREHRSWWANDSVSHVQSQQWLAAGWRVATVNMTDGIITFSRNRERELAYISFFSALLNDLRIKADFDVYDVSPGGRHWATAEALPRNNRKVAWLNFAFTRQKQLRVELYIDTENYDSNKRIFDALINQGEDIEESFGDILSWERLDTRRASRIATYHDGFITDKESDLVALRLWAVEAMIRLEKAITERTEKAIQAIQCIRQDFI